MWVMTPFGILMPSIRPAKTIEAGDNRTMQIRARRARDLDILRAEYMKDELGPTVFMRNTDYEYRAYCTREAWARAMANMALDIDYTKFKPTTERYHDHVLHALYNELWSVIQRRLSTTDRIRSYWGLDRDIRGLKRGNPRKQSRKTWAEELDELEAYEREEAERTTWEAELTDAGIEDFTGPDLKPDGSLDHSVCDHAPSNAARKRCRRRFLRNQK